MKYWEIIADNLSKAGWNWGRVLASCATNVAGARCYRYRELAYRRRDAPVSRR
jgi:hypothetical protein